MATDGASTVEYRLLGPVEVWAGGRRVDTGQPRQRAVLAALLVDAGRVVPVETLIGRVWGQTVSDNARATLRTHLSRIRRLLEQAGEYAASVAALSRISGGYVLQVDPDQIDLHLFRRLAGTAGHPDDTNSPVESLRAALALWRGQPLVGIAGEWADRMRESWSRERVDAAVVWARAELAQGNPRPARTGNRPWRSTPASASTNPTKRKPRPRPSVLTSRPCEPARSTSRHRVAVLPPRTKEPTVVAHGGAWVGVAGGDSSRASARFTWRPASHMAAITSLRTDATPLRKHP
jgi:DNA-binding winged helix-turn-helix (wHTH) protein